MTIELDSNMLTLAFGGLITILISSLTWFIKGFFKEQKVFNQTTASNIASISNSVARLEGKFDVHIGMQKDISL